MEIYCLTARFPKEELYGLTSQMRRAAVSVPANIAEGFARLGKNEKLNFYNIAQGSLAELSYFLILARDLSYIPDATNQLKNCKHTAKMLQSLMDKIRIAK
jgi:four helix bundle protein